MKRLKRLALFLLLASCGLWLNNTSVFLEIPPDRLPRLIAHRGVHHIYKGADRTNTTCRAGDVEPIRHGFIENTLPSMRAAFAHGADVVELDVHPTTDGHLAVFHDWTLDCQTDGQGPVRKKSMAALRDIDIGYGLSADGETFPVRGKGIGQLRPLKEVFDANLGPQYLVNFKSKTPQDAARLTELLKNPDYRNQVFGVYGGAAPTRAATRATVGLKGLDKPALKKCLLHYTLLGWSGFVPEACADRLIAVPMNVAPYLWGWPHVFTKRMQAANSDVILWGPYDGSGFSSGIDDLQTLQRVPKHFDGYVWTNRIERIAPQLKSGP